MSLVSDFKSMCLSTFFCAVLGFSYALATSNSDADSDTSLIQSRAVGTLVPLNFQNPFVSVGGNRDLGDVVAGQSFVRYVCAKGGLSPYKFTPKDPGDADSLATAYVTLQKDGIILGTPNEFVPTGAYPFNVTVADSSSLQPATKSETFELNFVQDTQFRFANSALCDGVQYQNYLDTCAVINAPTNYKMTVSNVSQNGTPYPDGLQSIGLFISDQGLVFGRPVYGGPIQFTVTAQDVANNATAAARNGTGTSQVFTLNIAAGVTQQTHITATSITIKMGNGVGKDSIDYSGVACLLSPLSSLEHQVLLFSIGNAGAPPALFDASGNASTDSPAVVSAKVGSNGSVKVAVKNTTIDSSSINSFFVTLPVRIYLGEQLMDTEFLLFSVKFGSGGARTLTYEFGKPGQTSLNPGLAGTFQILKAEAADSKDALGDAYKVSFVCLAPQGIDLSRATSCSVNIGSNYSYQSTLRSKGSVLSSKSDKTRPTVSAFSLDTLKGKGSFTTGVLPSVGNLGTGIPSAASGSERPFPVSVTFLAGSTVIYRGECAIRIYNSKTKYTSVH